MMAPTYLNRSIEPLLKRAISRFPAIVLTGPRQSGKTTLLKHLLGGDFSYVSLEPPDVKAAALEDPRGFLEAFPPPIIFDEVQYAPELLAYIKERIDEKRTRTGQYVLTGSRNLLLMSEISESLAGRAAMLRLLPMSRREAERHPEDRLPWERKSRLGDEKPMSHKRLWRDFLRGGYPELVASPRKDIEMWHASYVQTYLERDVRNIRQVGDLSSFQAFLRALAARSAQLINLADLSRDLGIALNTAKAWISVLEASYQVLVLRPYYANIGKRLVKTPKIYFMDVGTLCYLTGLKDPEHAAAGPLAGPIMETAVITEIIKTLTHQGIDPQIYFWRTAAGIEVDIVLEAAGKLIPIEVKVSATPKSAMASSIKTFRADFGDKAAPGYVVHPGTITLPLAQGVTAIPFAEL